jgi:hypothetical protein
MQTLVRTAYLGLVTSVFVSAPAFAMFGIGSVTRMSNEAQGCSVVGFGTASVVAIIVAGSASLLRRRSR